MYDKFSVSVVSFVLSCIVYGFGKRDNFFFSVYIVRIFTICYNKFFGSRVVADDLVENWRSFRITEEEVCVIVGEEDAD